MRHDIKIGIVGLDTSHVVAFTRLLNDPEDPHSISGAKVVAAYPGGSPDMSVSAQRLTGFTQTLQEEFGVHIEESIEDVASQVDAVLLESVDGRVHLSQFERIAPFGKPTFIDKPLATSYVDAQAIVACAKRYNVPIMSCSALRYAEALTNALPTDGQTVFGIDCFGPMALQPTQQGLFWYGIHTVEMLYAVLGTGCQKVVATTSADHDVVTGLWSDGRLGTLRGNRLGHSGFGALLHQDTGTAYCAVDSSTVPYYASLLQQVIHMFQTGVSPIPAEETLEIMRFIEAANESRRSGQPVGLGGG